MNISLDDIRARLSIEEVVSSYVQLKKSGRNFKGLCPFHQEKTPSFYVSTEKQLAYCFGCNRGGDIFTFVREIEGIDFRDAVKILAERAGIPYDSSSFSSRLTADAKEKDQSLYHLLRDACDFFVRQLWESADGMKVLEYVRSRGLVDDTIHFFQLGFAPDSFEATYQYLLNKGHSKENLIKAGLVRVKDTGGEKIYDYFRRRLMFPIFDVRGRVVAFGARSLKKGDDPKYLNSPDTPVYHKSSTLYGLFHAKQAIREADQALFVEGYMDVLASYQAGVCNVLASSGTALSSDQLRLVKRYTSNIIFSFDTDSAGSEATQRGIEIAQSMDVHLKILRVPEGKDPAEYIAAHRDAWQALVSQSEPYLDFCFRNATFNVDVSTEEGCLLVEESLLPVIKRISDSIERDRRVKQLAGILATEPKFVYERLERLKNISFPSNIAPQDSSSHSKHSVYEYFFALIYQYPEYFVRVEKLIKYEYFPKSLQPIYSAYLKCYNKKNGLDREAFLLLLSDADVEKIQLTAFKVEVQNEALSKELIQQEVEKVSRWISAKAFSFQRRSMISKLRSAEEQEAPEIFRKYCDFLRLWQK